jgi:preprotein translocase subunit YajC
MSSYYLLIVFFLCIYLPMVHRKRRRRRQFRRRMRKGEKFMAPKMLSECIGKQVTIYIEGGLGGYVATVLAVEDNFIKIEDKKNIRYVNADMVSEIRITK